MNGHSGFQNGPGGYQNGTKKSQNGLLRWGSPAVFICGPLGPGEGFWSILRGVPLRCLICEGAFWRGGMKEELLVGELQFPPSCWNQLAQLVQQLICRQLSPQDKSEILGPRNIFILSSVWHLLIADGQAIKHMRENRWVGNQLANLPEGKRKGKLKRLKVKGRVESRGFGYLWSATSWQWKLVGNGN